MTGREFMPDQEQALSEKDYWLKDFRCPLCGCVFQTIRLKARALTVVKREPDFFVQYRGNLPWVYEVAVCPNCAYACEQRIWKDLVIVDRDGLRQALDSVRPPDLRSFTSERTMEMGLTSFLLALITYSFSSARYYERANLALRAGYLARGYRERIEGGSEESELEFKKLAHEFFLKSYELEQIEETRFGVSGIMYIIGELYRQLGDYRQAVNWFSKVVHEKKCRPQILRLARDQWELAREQYKAEKASE